MKTRKITVFAIASILGAIALASCGRAVETSMNAAKAQHSTEAAQTAEAAAPAATQPAAEQSTNAAVSSNTETAPVAQNISYDTASNTFAYTQQTAPAYKAATPAEQAAANNALAYAGGNGKIVSSEAVQTNDGTVAYRFGILPVDNANASAWYYIAGENFAMTEGEWISNKDELTKDEWEHYYDSAEHRFASASQQAGLNAIAASGIADGMIVSCDFVNYDYDKLQYAFKVGVRPMSAPNAPVQYFMAGTDYAEKC